MINNSKFQCNFECLINLIKFSNKMVYIYFFFVIERQGSREYFGCQIGKM